MSAEFSFNSNRESYILEGPNGDATFRIVVPRELVDDETGDESSESARLDWLRANLPQILQAYTARTGGGRVKEPWNRVLVEEVD